MQRTHQLEFRLFDHTRHSVLLALGSPRDDGTMRDSVYFAMRHVHKRCPLSLTVARIRYDFEAPLAEACVRTLGSFVSL